MRFGTPLPDGSKRSVHTMQIGVNGMMDDDDRNEARALSRAAAFSPAGHILAAALQCLPLAGGDMFG